MLQDYFTNREPLLSQLKQTAQDPVRAEKRIWHIQGPTGMGKTILWTMLKAFCEEKGIPSHAVQCQPQFTELKILRGAVEDPSRGGIGLKTCLQRLNKLDQQEKTEGDKRREETVRVGGEIAKKVIKAAPVPGSGLIASLAPSAASLIGSLFRREDHRLRRDPVTELTASFLEDLNRLPGDNNRAVLMLDDFDLLAEEINVWAAKWLRRLPANVMVLLTGKRFPWTGSVHDIWPDCETAIRKETLQLFAEKDSCDFVRRYYRNDLKLPEPSQEEMASILKSAGNVPFMLWIVADARAKGNTAVGGVPGWEFRDAADKMRDFVPPELRTLFEAAAVLRTFDRMSLTAVAGPDETAKGFDALLDLRFVSQEGPVWVIHDFVREVITKVLRQLDPGRYTLLQGRALQYYRDALGAQDPAASTALARDLRQKLQLEVIYHAFRFSPDKEGTAEMCHAFDEAYYARRDFAFCQALVNDVGAQGLNESVGHWLELYRALLAPAERYVDGLEKVRSLPDLERPVKIQAMLALGSAYALEEHLDPARDLLNGALDECSLEKDSAENAVLKIKCCLGLAGLCKREGTADEYLVKAADWCQNIPEGGLVKGMLDRELADVYRLGGRFREAAARAKDAIDALRDRFAFELAHAYRVSGMVRVSTGDWNGANTYFGESIRLFEQMDPQKERRYEWVWLWMSLGDVALGQRQFATAREHYDRAREKAGKSEFESAVIDGCLADLLAAQDDWDHAIDLALASREVRKNHQDCFGVALTLDTEGRALCGKGQWTEAAKRLEEGANLARDRHWASLESRLTLSLAESYSRSGSQQFMVAADLVDKLANEQAYFDHLARLQFLLGERSVKQPDIAGAVKHFDAALEFAGKFNRWLVDATLDDIVTVSAGSASGELAKYAGLQSSRRLMSKAKASAD